MANTRLNSNRTAEPTSTHQWGRRSSTTVSFSFSSRRGIGEHVGVKGAVDVDAKAGLAIGPREPSLALSTGLLGDAHDLEQAGDVGLGPAEAGVGGAECDHEVLVHGVPAGLAGLG